MFLSLAVALLVAQEAPQEAGNADTQAAATQAQPAGDEEICRRIVVHDPRAPGGSRRNKVCKTKEEWKDYATRRT